MLRIYRVIPDPAGPVIASIAGDLPADILPFDGTSRAQAWEAFGRGGPIFRVTNPATAKFGNFFMLHSGVLVHDDAVADVADEHEFMNDDCEWLPGRLAEPAMNLHVRNFMGCYNCLDLDRSEFTTGPDGSVLSVTKHVFHVNRILDSPVFKIPETRTDTIYALSGRGDGDLLDFCREHDFTGLLFEEVWSGW